MPVNTVTGPIRKEDLGITLPHEHLFLDLRNQFTEFNEPAKRERSHQPVSGKHLDWLKNNPYALRDNLLLDDVELIVQEVQRFQKLGGCTVVDCTSLGIHRQPEKLREVARRTGLNIVAGCGYYTQDTHPSKMNQWTAEQIADAMVRDLIEGIQGTDIRAGVIGEIGTSHPIHPNERKSLEAAGLAHGKTGVPIQIHTYPWGQDGLEAADILLRKGVSPGKIVICHADVEPKVDYMTALLRKGVFLEFDDFGKEYEPPPDERGFAGGIFVKDAERVKVLKHLIDDGFERQLLITNDLCLKNMLHAYGGNGYDHILQNIVPMMREAGISPETVNRLLVLNPGELMDG